MIFFLSISFSFLFIMVFKKYNLGQNCVVKSIEKVDGKTIIKIGKSSNNDNQDAYSYSFDDDLDIVLEKECEIKSVNTCNNHEIAIVKFNIGLRDQPYIQVKSNPSPIYPFMAGIATTLIVAIALDIFFPPSE